MGAPIDPSQFLEIPPGETPALAFTPTAMDFDNPPVDPVAEIRRWLDEAFKLPVPNPNALFLATATPSGGPSVRTVLLKAFDERGLVFFTNRQSLKGKELLANPVAEALFYWDQLGRQIRVAGAVTTLTKEEDDAYFATRARDSQIGAWASDQSQELADRDTLMTRVMETFARYDGSAVPRPAHWGGFRIALDKIEFWQAHPFRIHDRVIYRRLLESGSRWNAVRLFP